MRKIGSVGAVMSALLASTAFAQTSGTATGEAAANFDGEILVTAQRRSERQQDVPLAVSAISPEFAARSGLVSVADLKFATPGTDITSSTGSIMLTMRGIGVQFVSPGLEPPVAIYVDNTYIPRTNGLNALLDLVDPGSVEIIRGPQGTLYGRNSTGGVIRVSSANPTNVLEGRVAAEYGRFEHKQIDGMLNIPVSENLALRFAGRWRKEDGYVKNFDGQTLPEVNNYTARARVRWTPSAAVEVVGGVEWIRSSANGFNDQLGAGAPTCYVCQFTGASSRGFYQADVNIISPYFNRAFRSDLRVNVALGDYTITSTTTWFNNFSEQDSDIDFTSLNQARYHVNRNGGKTFGQELQLGYDADGPLSYIVAASYLHDKAFIDFTLEGNAYQPFGFPRNNNNVKTESYSVLAEATYKLTDTIKVTAGGRYTSDKRTQNVNNNAGFQLFGAPPSFSASAKFDAFTPRFVLAWDNGPTNVYYSYTRGFKAGGLVSPSPFPGRAVDPEKIFSHEVGVKHSAMGGKLTTALSVFYYKNKGLQTQVLDASGAGTITENAGAAEGYGAELEVNAKPLDGLSLGGSIGYLHATYADYKNAAVNCYDPTGTLNAGFPGATLYSCRKDLTGTSVPHAPKLTLSANASYTFPIGAWSGSLSGLIQYRSKSLFWPGAGGELGYDRQSAYTIANFTGYISPPGDNLRVGFYVNNAFNTKYATIRTTSQPWGLSYDAAPPVTYGARVEYKF